MPEAPRPRRPVALPPEVVELVADVSAGGTPEAELLERLEAALRLLPAAERRAVLTAHASGDGVAAVAHDMELSDEDADALTRNAVQLLRGALADLEPERIPDYGTLQGPGAKPKRRPD